MPQTFRLFWLHESGCDAGVSIHASELEPSIQDRVLELARGENGLALRLPFLDRKDWRKRDTILGATAFERTGDLIRAVLDPAAATRDAAATAALMDPAWRQAPKPAHATYFPVWQKVSIALQRSLKRSLAGAYLSDPERCADRKTGYPVAAYRTSRACYGRPKTEFTYDLRDYPECKTTLTAAFKLTGRGTQAFLAELEAQLIAAGHPDVARWYAPVWYEDILVAARRKPKIFVDLLAKESAIVNAIIDLGSDPTVATINRTSRIVNANLRSVLGLDLRRMGAALFDEAVRVLAEAHADGFDDLGNVRLNQHADVRTPGRPNPRIGSQEDGDHRSAHGRGQMGNARIVPHIQPRLGQPTRQIV